LESAVPTQPLAPTPPSPVQSPDVLGNGDVSDAVGAIGSSIFGPLPNFVDLAIGFSVGGWLFFLIRVPWNLYLSARRVRLEGEENTEQGVKPDEGFLEKTRQLEKGLLIVVISAHLISAFGVYGIAWMTAESFIKKSTALIFIGAIFIRPLIEFKRHVVHRIETLKSKIRYPANHVQQLLTKIEIVSNKVEQLEHNNKKSTETLEKLLDKTIPEMKDTQNTLALREDNHHKALQSKIKDEVSALSTTTSTSIKDIKTQLSTDRQIVVTNFAEISKKFDSTVTEISNDKKILEGVRGFLEIVRQSLNQPQKPKD